MPRISFVFFFFVFSFNGQPCFLYITYTQKKGIRCESVRTHACSIENARRIYMENDFLRTYTYKMELNWKKITNFHFHEGFEKDFFLSLAKKHSISLQKHDYLSSSRQCYWMIWRVNVKGLCSKYFYFSFQEFSGDRKKISKTQGVCTENKTQPKLILLGNISYRK